MGDTGRVVVVVVLVDDVLVAGCGRRAAGGWWLGVVEQPAVSAAVKARATPHHCAAPFVRTTHSGTHSPQVIVAGGLGLAARLDDAFPAYAPSGTSHKPTGAWPRG